MKTGQPAYDSGMRGGGKPKDAKPHEGSASKGKLRRFEVESSDNGGHIITAHRDPLPASKDAEGHEAANVQGPERHVHPDKSSAHQHVGALLDEMGGAAGDEGAAKGKSSHLQSANPWKE